MTKEICSECGREFEAGNASAVKVRSPLCSECEDNWIDK